MFYTHQIGTGKLRVLGSIVKYSCDSEDGRKRLVAVAASTSISSFLIKGRTVHKLAGYGIEENNLTTKYH